MNCTGCPALRYALSNGKCVLGIHTAVTYKDGYRVRHPLSECKKPVRDAEFAERLDEKNLGINVK